MKPNVNALKSDLSALDSKKLAKIAKGKPKEFGNSFVYTNLVKLNFNF